MEDSSMKITNCHREFWMFHTGPSFMKPEKEVSVHLLIPRPRPTNSMVWTFNTVNLLMRKPRGGKVLREYLSQIASYPQCANPKHRAALAKKWLKQLDKHKTT